MHWQLQTECFTPSLHYLQWHVMMTKRLCMSKELDEMNTSSSQKHLCSSFRSSNADLISFQTESFSKLKLFFVYQFLSRHRVHGVIHFYRT